MGCSSVSFIQKNTNPDSRAQGYPTISYWKRSCTCLGWKRQIFTWGCGEKHQLARNTHHPELALRPTSIDTLPVRGAKASKVSCGSYHSFVTDQEGRVYAWGLNVYGELAIPDNAGEDGASQLKPCLVESLQMYRIVDIAGGEHHSLACTDNGELVTWGRIGGNQVGFGTDIFTSKNAIFNDRNN